MSRLLTSLRQVGERADIAFARASTIRELSLDRRELGRIRNFITFLTTLSPAITQRALALFEYSRAENFQDIFAMLALNEQERGYFVEFGAADGVAGSNSYLMEKGFGWSGLLAEPARVWLEALRSNRSASISQKCVWRESQLEIEFREARMGGLSTIASFADSDRHSGKRRDGRTYTVETITLDDLLDEQGAPDTIDFMSIDTEGSEFDILSRFDWDRRRVRVLTIEHNDRPQRADLFTLLSEQGYDRAPCAVSRFDDWYVEAALSRQMRALFSEETWEASQRNAL